MGLWMSSPKLCTIQNWIVNAVWNSATWIWIEVNVFQFKKVELEFIFIWKSNNFVVWPKYSPIINSPSCYSKVLFFIFITKLKIFLIFCNRFCSMLPSMYIWAAVYHIWYWFMYVNKYQIKYIYYIVFLLKTWIKLLDSLIISLYILQSLKMLITLTFKWIDKNNERIFKTSLCLEDPESLMGLVWHEDE